MRKSDIATENITSVALHETAKTRYITYALSVIGSRALPDLRDGMKPVQRRILYGMKEMRLDHDAKYRKSAQVVGSVMGRYHPHGDGAIYDAMVRMAQPFSLRYPLVDGQGNFGSMDGDAAAAMRYTEARLQSLSALMLDDLSENIVDYRSNYDGSLTEPSVLPAVFPNLLVNGSTGIAVGMATNIPPHNLSEILDACVLLLEKPESVPDEVLNIVKGPDFPTGGKIFNTREELREIYTTGRGSIDLRGDWHVENTESRQWVVIDEIPYGVNKSKLVTQIADAILSSKLPLLTNVRDESTDKVRIVTECRPGADPEAVIAYLMKNTELATKFSVNMTCLVPDEASAQLLPDRLGIVDIIKHFLSFRVEVVTRRLREQLEQLRQRIHILEAFAKIYADLDTAIRIIREAEDKNDASEKLCAHFDLDAEQAEAILQTRLYKLAKLEIEKIEAELKAKRAEAAHIIKILESKSALRNVVKSELENVKKNFGDERRTKFGCEVSEKQFNAEDYIISEDVFVFITKEGMIKRQRSYTDLSGVRVRDNDAVKIIVKANTKDALILFTNYGKAYTLPVVNVPQSTGYGMPVQSKFKFDDGESIIASYLSVRSDEAKNGEAKNAEGENADAGVYGDNLPPCLIPITSSGLIARIPLENFEQNSTANGRTFLKLKDGDRVVKICFDKAESRYVCLISKKTRASVFRLDEIPLFKGIGKGNKAVAMDRDDEILDCCLASDDSEGLKVTLSGGRVVDINARRIMSCKRGSAGRIISRSDTTLFPEEEIIEIFR